MSQDADQNQQNNYPQGQPYEPTQAAPPLNFDGQGNPSSSPYNPMQPGSSPYPTPSSASGNYTNLSGYPPAQTTGNNPYENAAPSYMFQPQPGPYPPYPQPGSYPQPGPYPPYPQPGPYGSPYPGYQPPQPPKKSKAWLWITLSVVGGILIIGIIACAFVVSSFSSLIQTASTSASSTVTAESTTDAIPESTAAPVEGNDPGVTDISPATVGQTNTLQNVDCIVTAVKKAPGDADAQPKAGDEYIVIHVKLTNKSSEKQNYNPLDFKVTDPNGKSVTNTYMSPDAYSNQLSFGDLETNQTVEGDLVFEVSSSEHTQTLNWDPVANEFADNPGEADWTLHL